MTAMALVQSVRSAATSVPEGCPGIPEEEHQRGVAHRLDQGEPRRVDTCVRRTHKRIKCKFKSISTKINNKGSHSI